MRSGYVAGHYANVFLEESKTTRRILPASPCCEQHLHPHRSRRGLGIEQLQPGPGRATAGISAFGRTSCSDAFQYRHVWNHRRSNTTFRRSIPAELHLLPNRISTREPWPIFDVQPYPDGLLPHIYRLLFSACIGLPFYCVHASAPTRG